MCLLYDLTRTQPGLYKRHGGGYYGEVVFKRIVEKGLPVACVVDSSRWLNPAIEQIIKTANVQSFDVQLNDIRSIIKTCHFKIYYSPLPVIEDYSDLGCRVRCTIHGPRALELKYDRMMWRYKTTSVAAIIKFLIKNYTPSIGYRHAYKSYEDILTLDNYDFTMVSNHSKYSLISYLPSFKDRNIPVFYSPLLNTIDINERVYDDNYFLMVSADRWEKNNLRAIIALDRLFSQGMLADKRVKVTGASTASVFRYKIKNEDKFDFLGYVEEKDLCQLYHDAYCMIYPSLNEGFGYPPLEAMYYGVPVIASPFASITEILEGAALYANPLSIEELMARILRINDPEVHRQYFEAGKIQAMKVRKRQNSDLEHLIEFIYNQRSKVE